MGQPLLVGIDKGTSVTKAAVFDTHGNQLSEGSRRIRALHPHPAWHEEDPEVSWASTAEAVRAALQALPAGAGTVVGVSTSGHMGGAWLLDAEGRPTRNAVAWPDARATRAVVDLERGPLHEEYLDLSGCGALPGMTLMILGELVKTEPEVLARTRSILFAKDYVQYRLTGVRSTDPSDVAFAPGDVAKGTWSTRLLEMVGAEAYADRFPEVREFGSVVGTVTREAAEQTGLPEGCPVVNGMGDAVASMVGCGAIHPGEAVSILGTSWLACKVVSTPVAQPRGIGWLYPMPGGNWVHVMANTSGASTLDWWLAQLAGEHVYGGVVDFAAVEAELAASQEGHGDITFLPYLSAAGVQAPFKDESLRGTLLGLTDRTTRGELLRAVYEGLVHAMTDNYDAQGGRPHLVRLTGGGARSSIWPETLSNVLQAPVELPVSSETAALGVALMAGVGAGVWDDRDTAAAAMVRVRRRVDPDPALAAPHAERLRRYRDAQQLARAFFASRAARTD